MADYDSADLLARFKRYQRRPTADEKLDTDGVYALLTEAQAWFASEIAIYCPQVLLEAPVKLNSSDNGVTYPFPNDSDGDPIAPLYCEIAARDGGNTLWASTYFDPRGDFVIENDRIRMPGGRARSFGDGPYVRLITPPGAISASSEPVERIKPKAARMVIVWKALELWAAVGGELDEAPFTQNRRELWGPEVNRGTYLMQWKRQFANQGQPSSHRFWAQWMSYIDAVAMSDAS